MSKKIVFMGTASFSLKVLQMLLENKYDVVGVVTQPDRYVGRKKVLTMSDVKQEALKHDIPVLQPERIRNDYQAVLDLKPDLIITAAYGQIVPTAVLEAPRLGCVNVHASLLPLYRGGAPVHRAIIDGRKETGVTIMYMAEKMDAGDIISQKSTPITDDDNLEIVYVNINAEKNIPSDFTDVIGIGPREFLGLIKNAEVVITTSFHAMAFSLIFNKKFY